MQLLAENNNEEVIENDIDITPEDDTTTVVEDEPKTEKAIPLKEIDITLSHKMDAKIKALRDREFDCAEFGVEMWIPTEEIMIDEQTQRGIMVSQVEKIINEFNPSSFGIVEIN